MRNIADKTVLNEGHKNKSASCPKATFPCKPWRLRTIISYLWVPPKALHQRELKARVVWMGTRNINPT